MSGSVRAKRFSAYPANDIQKSGRCRKGGKEGKERRTFLILLRTNPHLLERTETRQDRPADPGGVLPLGRGRDANFRFPESEFLHFVEEAVAETCWRVGQYNGKGGDEAGGEKRGKGRGRRKKGGRNDTPFTSVPPPLNTTFPNKLFLRSKSARLIESTTTWCTPLYSSPTSSGLKSSSGAR
jgi:hypothetical protein